MTYTAACTANWLEMLESGTPEALDELVSLLYTELRRLARGRLRGERRHLTLCTTMLVNEAYLELRKRQRIHVEDRGQFLAVAGLTMRRILVDYARTRKRAKRGHGVPAVPLDEVAAFLSDSEADELIALDEALTALEQIDPRGAEVVSHRFFLGLSLQESAELLAVSTKTVHRSWVTARAWLRKEVALELGAPRRRSLKSA